MPTILVVDDDDAIVRLLRTTLADLGEVVCARSGEEAMAAVDGHRPDIVILDVGLPDMSGLDLLRRWRADEGTWDLDVVVLSGRVEATDEAAGYTAGADAYVTKPVDVDVLEGLVGAMLAHQAEERRATLGEFRNIQLGDFPA